MLLRVRAGTEPVELIAALLGLIEGGAVMGRVSSGHVLERRVSDCVDREHQHGASEAERRGRLLHGREAQHTDLVAHHLSSRRGLRDPALAGTPQAEGTWNWGGVYGHHWYVDPVNRLRVIALTNTALEGMVGGFVGELMNAVYG